MQDIDAGFQMNILPDDEGKEGLFERLREGEHETFRQALRWGGFGRVDMIYYLADDLILNYVRFVWSSVSDRPGVKPPTIFRVNSTVNRSLVRLLPQLERAQSTDRLVFVDFETDSNGGNANVITLATF
jgi:hypothetical protein